MGMCCCLWYSEILIPTQVGDMMTTWRGMRKLSFLSLSPISSRADSNFSGVLHLGFRTGRGFPVMGAGVSLFPKDKLLRVLHQDLLPEKLLVVEEAGGLGQLASFSLTCLHQLCSSSMWWRVTESREQRQEGVQLYLICWYSDPFPWRRVWKHLWSTAYCGLIRTIWDFTTCYT